MTLNQIFGLEKSTEDTNQAVMITKVDFWSNRPLLRTLTRLVLSKSTVSTAKLNLKTGTGIGTIQLPLPDIVILKEKSENWLEAKLFSYWLTI